MALLSVRDVTRRFGGIVALDQVSFDVEEGQIVGLIGPNGAGKSTLVGMLATLVSPSSGEVRFGDRPSRALGSDVRRHIGLLAHELLLYPELSARQNLTFFAQLYGLDRPAANPPRRSPPAPTALPARNG